MNIKSLEELTAIALVETSIKSQSLNGLIKKMLIPKVVDHRKYIKIYEEYMKTPKATYWDTLEFGYDYIDEDEDDHLDLLCHDKKLYRITVEYDPVVHDLKFRMQLALSFLSYNLIKPLYETIRKSDDTYETCIHPEFYPTKTKFIQKSKLNELNVRVCISCGRGLHITDEYLNNIIQTIAETLYTFYDEGPIKMKNLDHILCMNKTENTWYDFFFKLDFTDVLVFGYEKHG